MAVISGDVTYHVNMKQRYPESKSVGGQLALGAKTPVRSHELHFCWKTKV